MREGLHWTGLLFRLLCIGHSAPLACAAPPRRPRASFASLIPPTRPCRTLPRAKTKKDITTNKKGSFKLRVAVEKLKKILSANAEAPLNVECILEDEDMRCVSPVRHMLVLHLAHLL